MPATIARLHFLFNLRFKTLKALIVLGYRLFCDHFVNTAPNRVNIILDYSFSFRFSNITPKIGTTLL